MTETTNDGPSASVRRNGHLGDLELRRYRAGESIGSGRDTHASSCAECVRRLGELTADQKEFEQRISFDRFAAGVERAARVPGPATTASWWGRPATTRSFVTVMSVGTLAACLALVVGVRPLFEAARLRRATEVGAAGSNRIKGATAHAAITMRIGSENGPQRTAGAEAPEPLAPGERIRVGVQPGVHRFLFAISIDDQGAVTPLYPEVGTSMPLPRGGGLQYLPDSLELTGKGRERLVVLLTDAPLELDSVRHAVAAALRSAGGDLGRLQKLPLAAEQFHRTFLKP